MQSLIPALTDPDLGFTAFTVQRTTYRRQNGTSVPSVQTLPASGCIHPGTPEMLQLLTGGRVYCDLYGFPAVPGRK